jgi:hypothetical protein
VKKASKQRSQKRFKSKSKAKQRSKALWTWLLAALACLGRLLSRRGVVASRRRKTHGDKPARVLWTIFFVAGGDMAKIVNRLEWGGD